MKKIILLSLLFTYSVNAGFSDWLWRRHAPIFRQAQVNCDKNELLILSQKLPWLCYAYQPENIKSNMTLRIRELDNDFYATHEVGSISVKLYNSLLKNQKHSYGDLLTMDKNLHDIFEIIRAVQNLGYVVDASFEPLIQAEKWINEAERKAGEQEFPNPESGMGILVRIEKFGQSAESLRIGNELLKK